MGACIVGGDLRNENPETSIIKFPSVRFNLKEIHEDFKPDVVEYYGETVHFQNDLDGEGGFTKLH
jgi:hypothetical protein